MWFGLTIMVVMCVGLIVWILYATGILSKNKNKKGKQDS
jgi:type IV secretory pathway TrbL component